MSPGQRGCLLLAAGLLAALVAPVEAPRAFGGSLGPGSIGAGAPTALPGFALFGWVSPPAESTTAARYAEMAGAGFNLAMAAWADSGDVAVNRARLAAAQGLDLELFLLDQQLDRDPYGTPQWSATLDTVATRYRDDPRFAGYYLGDEPALSQFGKLGQWFAALRARDPAHPAWNNLYGRAAFTSHDAFETYVRQYVSAVHPAVLCDDHYDFLESGDRGEFVENAATLGGVARENGLPFWGIVLLTQHADYRAITAGLLRWQVAQWLAYGAHGIGYFTYWTPAPDPRYAWQPAMIAWDTGERTPLYDLVRDLDTRLRPLGDTLATLGWLGAAHAGSVPGGGAAFVPGALVAGVSGRATLGYFADAAAAPYVLVANADSSAAASVVLGLAAGRAASRLSDDGRAWQPLGSDAMGRVTLALDAGDFALLRLSGAVDSLATGRAPRLFASPNPARGAVIFSAQGTVGAARLELFDVSGRRLWSRAVAGGNATIAWDGTAAGGRAPTGAVFARLTDARGSVVRRVAWLGAR